MILPAILFGILLLVQDIPHNQLPNQINDFITQFLINGYPKHNDIGFHLVRTYKVLSSQSFFKNLSSTIFFFFILLHKEQHKHKISF